MSRTARIERVTNESKVLVELDLDDDLVSLLFLFRPLLYAGVKLLRLGLRRRRPRPLARPPRPPLDGGLHDDDRRLLLLRLRSSRLRVDACETDRSAGVRDR